MCFDGLQLVLSRLALLDIFLAFFVLCAVSCLVADRDWCRAGSPAGAATPSTGSDSGWGRSLLWRPWRLAAGVCFGAGHRHEVVRAVPAGGVRPAGVGVGRRGAPLLRRTLRPC